MPRWAWLVPAIAIALFIAALMLPVSGVFALICAAALIGSVIAAVHHAEVVAHRVGEPFGTLVLALAVTIIEVALIVTLMADGGDKSSTLARHTVFAAVMIT